MSAKPRRWRWLLLGILLAACVLAGWASRGPEVQRARQDSDELRAALAQAGFRTVTVIDTEEADGVRQELKVVAGTNRKLRKEIDRLKVRVMASVEVEPEPREHTEPTIGLVRPEPDVPRGTPTTRIVPGECEITQGDLFGRCKFVLLEGSQTHGRILWWGGVRLPDDSRIEIGPVAGDKLQVSPGPPRLPRRLVLGLGLSTDAEIVSVASWWRSGRRMGYWGQVGWDPSPGSSFYSPNESFRRESAWSGAGGVAWRF